MRKPEFGVTQVVTIVPEANAVTRIAQFCEMTTALECIAEALRAWAEEHGITLAFIESGKPSHNAYIERSNRTFCYERLDAWDLTSLAEVRAASEEGRLSYDTGGARDSLRCVPPTPYSPAESYQRPPGRFALVRSTVKLTPRSPLKHSDSVSIRSALMDSWEEVHQSDKSNPGRTS